MNRVILCLKRNDQYHVLHKNRGHKNLMPVFWHDEAVHGEFDLITERLQMEAFVHLVVSRDSIPFLKLMVEPELDPLGNIIRERKYFFKPNKFEKLVGNKDILSKIRSPDFMPVIDVTDKNLMDFVDVAKSIDWNKFQPQEDVKAVSSGTYNYGGGGDPYAKLSACIADTAQLTGDLTFNINADITETSQVSDFTDANGFDMTYGAANTHGGDVTAAHTITVAHNAHGFVLYSYFGTGHLNHRLKGFKLERTTAASDSGKALVTNNSFEVFTVSDMYLNGGGLTGNGLIATNNEVAITRVATGCVIWDCANDGLRLVTNNPTKGGHYENIYIRNCGVGVDSTNRANKLYNIFSANNTTDYANVTNGVAESISATDTTAFGTNPNDSLTEANEVISTSDSNAEFGHLKSGGTNEGSGIIPVYATADMAGVSYASAYPIGPFMLATAAGSPYYYYLQQQLLAG